ncbi:GNAT family N-acetyltransferase [Streptomyces sp. SID486]|uniref:GNAT family N-acetyltransferase n=1 Tax=unclassified Streptomyces TaxID=2593676 RepID=UPI0013680403|nr:MULTISPECIES: GNAT family N-acetyltransferase [unclassified Streptomyces]MYW15149.1 GNAT family N-acetyltransferase [Streptomyces sp. SID2955]MYW42744.1 GNAT family N-acetyltransferase [Streptomyces sp. SID161]MYX99833.1 GNAT family N-acetyltransferase [Streptomyces sp. SID486]
MTVLVRDLRPDVPADAEGFARVRRLALPYILFTPESVRHTAAHMQRDARFRPLVAEEDGEVTGTAQVHLVPDSREPGQACLNIYVRPDRTGRGAGRLLVEAAEEYLASLGATRLFAWALDEPANRAFAERRGYRPGRSAHFLRLDLANGPLPPLMEVPAGVELRTAAEFADDPRPLFELDAETLLDEPGDVEYELADYDAWVEQTWNHPLLDRELTVAACVDGRPVAFSVAYTDGGTRYSTAMTGTARGHRGRGLAKLAKVHALHRARAAGLTEAFTGNDTGNDAMIAINEWLGYEICATEVRYVRDVG